MSEENKPSEELRQDVIDSDPVVIALRERVVHIRAMMGETYAIRVELELADYIKVKYPQL